MDILSKENFDNWIDQNYSNKLKQREALENAHSNFVEPHINQIISIDPNPLPTISPAPYGFYFVSVWIGLTLLYCVWLHIQVKR